jgi:hypothetical protein
MEDIKVVNRRETDNAMAKAKKHTGRTTICKTLDRKLKNQQREPH